jgi:hypothetical protein
VSCHCSRKYLELLLQAGLSPEAFFYLRNFFLASLVSSGCEEKAAAASHQALLRVSICKSSVGKENRCRILPRIIVICQSFCSISSP